jgi:hypothetical protein
MRLGEVWHEGNDPRDPAGSGGLEGERNGRG